ncbi:MAG: 2-keto-4-pentenoate hydratase [Burkholderiales bacterium]
MLAQDLISLHENPREVPLFSERYRELSTQAAYAAARGLHEHRLARGWRAVGRKIGFTNRTIWPRYGVYEPIWGTVYDHTLIEARGNQAKVALAGLVNPRIEPEICFGLRDSPEPGRVLQAIEWMAHSIEIVQCHHANWKLTLADSAADNGLHGRLIVGERRPLPKGVEAKLRTVAVELHRGDMRVDRGVGSNVLGSPLAALEHLVEVLAKQAEAPALAAGEIVTTGVITDAHPVKPGEHWHTRISGLEVPGLSVQFV